MHYTDFGWLQVAQEQGVCSSLNTYVYDDVTNVYDDVTYVPQEQGVCSSLNTYVYDDVTYV